MKKIFTLIAACVLGAMSAMAEVTTIYERGGSGTAWSDADLTEWTADYATLAVTSNSIGSSTTNGGWTAQKNITTTTNSIVTFTATLTAGLASGRSGSYDFVNVGGVELRTYGQDNKASVVVNGSETNLSGFTRNGTFTISASINQATGAVSWEVTGKSTGTGSGTVNAAVSTIKFGHYKAARENYQITATLNSINVAEEIQAVTTYNYTIKYVFGEDVVKTVTGSTTKDANVSTLYNFVADEVKYYRADGQPESVTIDSDNKVVNITVRKANVYTYTLTKSIAGTPAGTIASGTVDEDEESPLISWSKYIKDNGKYYRSSFYTGNYGRQFYGSQNWDENVNYVEDNSIDYFIEGENMSKSRSAAASLTDFGYSGGTTSRHYASSQWWTEAMPKGVYTLKVSYYNTFASGTDMYIGLRDSEGNIVDTDKAFILYGARATTEEIADIAIPDGYALVLNNKNTYNSNGYIDYITMKKTAEVVETNASKTASYVTASALDFTDSGLKAYVATACDGSKITLKEVTTVAAGQAIVVKSETENASVKVKVAAGEVSPETNLFQTGAITVAAGQNVYALSKTDGQFHKVAEGTNIPAGKAYIIASSAAKTLTLDFDGAATGINNATVAKMNGSAINLMGQKVSANAKGIVIINGKKVVK